MKKIEIKVIAKSSKNEVVGFFDGVLKVKCKAVAEKGKANEAVIILLANYYNVPKSGIKIIKGKKSSKKTVLIQSTRYK